MIPRRPLAVMLAVLALSACQVPPVEPATRRSPATKKPEVAASPTPRATDAPSAAPSADAAPALRTLLAPPGTPTVMKGVLTLDAGYLLGTGIGSLISDKGSGALAVVAGGGLLSNNGAGVVTASDGTLLASGAGNLISEGGGAVIGNNGGSLTGKVKYALGGGFGLLDDAPAPATDVQLGTELPAVGMALRGYALEDDTPLSLGVDAAGAPVYEIFTNATGAFEIYPTAELKGLNIRLEAVARGSGGDDRLAYQRVATYQLEDSLAIDEDTRLVARYLRQVVSVRLRRQIWGPEAPFTAGEFNLSPELTAHGAAIRQAVTDAANAQGLATAPQAVQDLAAQRLADAVLAFIDLANMKSLDDKTPVLGELASVLRALNETSAQKLRDVPTFFPRQAYLARYKAAHPDEPAPVIQKPSDVADFMLRGPLAEGNDERNAGIREVLGSLTIGDRMQTSMIDVCDAVGRHIVLTLLLDDGCNAAAIAALKRPLN